MGRLGDYKYACFQRYLWLKSNIHKQSTDRSFQSRIKLHVRIGTPPLSLSNFEAALVPEDDGGFSVFALNYPGVVSQGDTVEEATANIAEAFQAMRESRIKHVETMEFSQTPTVELTTDCQCIRA